MEGPNNHGVREMIGAKMRHLVHTQPRETQRQSIKSFGENSAVLADVRDDLHAFPVPNPLDASSMASYRHAAKELARREKIAIEGVRQEMELVVLDHLRFPWRSRTLASTEMLVAGERNPLLDDQPDQSGDLWTVPKEPATSKGE